MNLKQRILTLLERTGLTPSEAKFYLVAHQNPKLTIKEIQKEARLSRTTAYRAFEKLKNLGLLTSSQESWRKNIETVSLNTVAEKLAKEQRQLRKVELELKSINNLMGLTAYSHMEEPLEIITDQNKITDKAFEILSRPWDKFLCYGSAERLLDVIGDDEEKAWVKERARRGKEVDVYLTELGDYSDYFLPDNTKDLRNVKIDVNPKVQDYMTYIYDNEVAIWHRDKELGNRGIIIKDPMLVRMHANMFKSLWDKK